MFPDPVHRRFTLVLLQLIQNQFEIFKSKIPWILDKRHFLRVSTVLGYHFFFSFFLLLFLADLGNLLLSDVTALSVLDVRRLAEKETFLSDLSEEKLTADTDLGSELMGDDSDSFSSRIRLKCKEK